MIGARFRPGGLAAWTGLDVSRLTDRVVPAAAVFGPALDSLALHSLAPTIAQLDEADRSEMLQQALVELGGGERRPDCQLADLMRRIDEDETLVRVEQVVQLTGWSVRTLQRKFKEQVGVSPKWVLARARLTESRARPGAGRRRGSREARGAARLV